MERAASLGRSISGPATPRSVADGPEATLVLRNIVSGQQAVTEEIFPFLGVKMTDPKLDYTWSPVFDRLGKGGCAVVYKARQVGSRKPSGLARVRSGSTAAPAADDEVAIKVIDQQGVTEQDMNTLWREVAVMRMIAKGPVPAKSTLPLYAAYMWQRTLYLVVRYCKGGAVEPGTQWREGDVACIAESILRGLKTMHASDCVHHDIKPANLLLLDSEWPPEVAIADYGASLIVDERDKGLKADFGTPGFAPPEWMGGRHEYDKSSDVFSTGVTVCALLSGALPFNGEPFERAQAEGRLGSSLPPELVRLDEDSSGMRRIVSKPARDFVRSCCAFDAADRWTVEQLLDHPWLEKYGRGKGGGRKLDLFADEIRAQLTAGRMESAVETGFLGGRLLSAPDQAAVAMVERHPIPEDALKAEFTRIVPAGGELDIRGFSVMMERLKCDHMPLQSLFRAFDTDGSGGISMPELVVGLGLLRQQDPSMRADLVIRMYSGADGTLTVESVTDALRSVSNQYLKSSVFKDSQERMKRVLGELSRSGEEGRIRADDLKEAVLADRDLLRLFLAPGAAAYEMERIKREREEWQWLISFIGEAQVANRWRSLYLVCLVAAVVLLVLHFAGLVDVDAFGAWIMGQLIRAGDSMGAVDGDGSSAGDLDVVLDGVGGRAIDIA